MDDKQFTFYALMVNGHTASIHIAPEDAIEELSLRMQDCDDDRYGIEPINGIWEMIKRYGYFEDYDDDWMIEVVDVAADMIREAKQYRQRKLEEAKEEQK